MIRHDHIRWHVHTCWHVVCMATLAGGCVGCATTSAQTAPRRQPTAPIILLEGAGATRTSAALRARRQLRIEAQPLTQVLQARQQAGLNEAAKRVSIETRDARATLQRAREAYRQLDFAASLKLVEHPLSRLTAIAPAGEQVLAPLRELLLHQMLSHLALKQQPAATEALKRAIAIGYGGPAAGEHPPEVEQFIESTRRAQQSSVTGELAVLSRPKGARVTIDGKPAGTTPLSLAVPSGPHLVIVQAVGRAPHAQWAPSRGALPQRVEVDLRPHGPSAVAAQLLAAAQSDTQRVVDHPQALRTAVGPQRAVLEVHPATADAKTAPALKATMVWTGKADQAVQTASCEGSAADALAQCLTPQLMRMTGAKASPSVAPTAGQDQRWYQRWWVWAIVGGVAAASTGTAVYLATRQPSGVDVYASFR